jgi:imidazolonepropionase-like amidohydrolase
LVERKVMVDPTLTVFRNMLLLPDVEEVYAHPDNARIPERLKAHWTSLVASLNRIPATRELRRREFQKYIDLTGILYRAGVILLVGTDSAEPYCPPGYSVHQELEMFVEAGIPPAAALRAATLTNAQSLRQAANLGSIAPGKLADIVILSADPLADIRNTRKIEKTVRGGIVCDPAALLDAVPVK